MVTPWCSEALAKSRILSGMPWMCWEHREALHTASPWKAGLGEVGLCRCGSRPWQNWSFKIHIYSSASLGGQDCRSARDERGGHLHQAYRFIREDERGRCWQERTCTCIKFGLPNSAEKVKMSFVWWCVTWCTGEKVWIYLCVHSCSVRLPGEALFSFPAASFF